jgi:hypothetical protein
LALSDEIFRLVITHQVATIVYPKTILPVIGILIEEANPIKFGTAGI